MFIKLKLGLVAFGLLASIVASSAHGKKFARDCAEAQCSSDERCVVHHVACDKDQHEGKHCGTGVKCVQDEKSADQQLIDTTSTTANNARAPIISPSTSTIQLNDEPNPILSPNLPSMELDRDFELLSPEAGISLSPLSHADQVQANVLVVVQDAGSQQSGNNPYLNPNYNRQNWGQPCVVSPYYPYACTNYSPTQYLPASRSAPSYATARAARGPQLVPPTPPCYYNCYPRMTAGSYPRQTGGYPLARSVQPSSALTNNYLLYITI